MGSAAGEACREPGAALEDLHQVTLLHDFEMQSVEVTQAQFESLMGYNPSHFSLCGGDCPVESVNWHEAAAYCNALAAASNFDRCYVCAGSGTSVTCQEAPTFSGASIYSCPGYRLPTEAEWEYAYRAGTTTPYYNGANDPSACSSCTPLDANADKIAWYWGNSTASYGGCDKSGSCGCIGTHPVGQKQPNAWGLYDMAGNVWEWCNDRYQQSLGSADVTDPWGAASGADRILRGGAYLGGGRYLRAAGRSFGDPALWYESRGFRCARTK